MNAKTLTSSVPVGAAEITDFCPHVRINSAEHVRAMGSGNAFIHFEMIEYHL